MERTPISHPFMCEKCGNSYTTLRSLTRHQKDNPRCDVQPAMARQPRLTLRPRLARPSQPLRTILPRPRSELLLTTVARTDHPATNSTRQDDHASTGKLPAGWEERRTAMGNTYFVDHNTCTSAWEDPRQQQPVTANTTTSAASQAAASMTTAPVAITTESERAYTQGVRAAGATSSRDLERLYPATGVQEGQAGPEEEAHPANDVQKRKIGAEDDEPSGGIKRARGPRD